MHFGGDRFQRIRVDDRPNGGKKLCFKTKTDKCGRGLIKVIKTGIKNAEQNLVYEFIQAFHQYIQFKRTHGEAKKS